ncbi:MAG: PCMD domain-containing protein [Fibromonadales bacterium]|nr:PCMD domain-containing protein [Fibromonadales bacterium]
MRKISLSIFVFILFYSCSSEDVKISENYIEKFVIDSINPIEINIKNNQSLIYIWTESPLYDSLKKQIPYIEVSEGATLSESERYLKYIVTAENGNVREYNVEIDTTVPRMFSFDFWNLSEGSLVYYVPSSLKWASGNAGIGLALSMLKIDSKNPENYPTKKINDGYKNNAVLMETIKGGLVIGQNIPIISGNFFLGKFNTGKMTDPLAATEIGYIYPAKPKSIKGYYKYEEGPEPFIGSENPSKSDSCNMDAWFYKSEGDTTLTIKNIDETDLVIAKAKILNCTNTNGKFKEFEAIFHYTSEPDFENCNYKLGVAFAASKEGGNYAGRVGSKLIIDEVEIEDY